jgi:plastocyanin
VVRESRETTGGVPLSERETRQIQQEGTTETGEMNQSSLSEENKSVSQIHTIVLIKNAFSPEISEINQYDTVVWRNLNRPKRTFVLASKDKLWKDFSLGYGRSFKYTFNETGTFDFSIKGESGMGGTVLVIVPRETGGLPLSERETRQVQPGEEGVTPTLIEEVTPAQRAEEIPSSTVLIRGSVFYPKTLEINKGEAVVWNNLNRPKRTFTLVSEEGLFENQAVGYGKSFSYTFNDAGGYTFKLEEIPGSEFILTVK